jgi:hypothetical protein
LAKTIPDLGRLSVIPIEGRFEIVRHPPRESKGFSHGPDPRVAKALRE